MLKSSLLLLALISFLPLSAFASSSIELSSDQETIHQTDSFLIYGKITGVSTYSKVDLSVIAPDGETVYSFNVGFDNEGTFKRLIHPPIPSFKPGIYTVIATHEEGGLSAKLNFTVLGKELPRGIISTETVTPKDKTTSDMYIVANAVEGDTEINIVGKTIWTDRDITLKVSSPNGNLITVAQISPDTNGDFSTKIKIGGTMWKEDGMYTVTAFQGDHSELKDSVNVEIANGVVVPEFGTIAAMILAISLISLIAFSAKSKLSVLPRF